MGMVQRQGVFNTFLSYAGVGIGTLNLIFLYPIFFQADEIGLIRILSSFALLFSHVSSLGIAGIVIRFLPHFKTDDHRNHGFSAAVWSYAAVGFLIASALYMLLRPWILPYYDHSELFSTYDLYVIPLALFVLGFNMVEVFDRAYFQSVFTLFCREVLLRLFTTVGIIAVGWSFWSFETFIIWFLCIHATVGLLALGNSIRSGRIHWHFDMGFFKIRRLKVLQRYGFFTFLTTVSTFVVQTIDSIMLGAYVNLEAVGIYTIAFFMGSVIAMPARSVSRIAVPVIAQAWKDNDLGKISQVYASTSFLQFLSGAIILCLILFNLDSIFTFLPPIYTTGFGVVLLIGLGHWIDMTGGLNANILMLSAKFHLDIYINSIFIIASILLNILFIPAYGLTGAALASFLSFVILNTARCIILYHLFGFNPFGWRFATAGILVSIVGFATWHLPFSDWSPYIAIPVRSIVFVALLAAAGFATGLHKQIRSAIHI